VRISSIRIGIVGFESVVRIDSKLASHESVRSAVLKGPM
jgi:hypothetical protein